jgi:hypothetical protein
MQGASSESIKSNWRVASLFDLVVLWAAGLTASANMIFPAESQSAPGSAPDKRERRLTS